MKILVCSLSYADDNPRPNRVISFFKKTSDVSFFGFGSTIHNHHSYTLNPRNSFIIRAAVLISKLLRLHGITSLLIIRKPKELTISEYNLVFCHSPEFFPILLKQKSNTKIVFDAREYYARHFENSFIWKTLTAPFQKHLCREYLHKIDYGITVSHGLANEYKKQFGVVLDVIYSLPAYVNLSPVRTTNDIRLIYHGLATPARDLKRIIKAMDLVRAGVSLDIMLQGDSKYTKKIIKMANSRFNIRVRSPVRYCDIITTIHGYDAAVIFFPPSTFNLQHCMPNKLFEAIQARIALIVSPLEDLSNFVFEHDVGFISNGFSPQDLAACINQIEKSELDKKKENSNKIAKQFSQGKNDERLSEIVKSLT